MFWKLLCFLACVLTTVTVTVAENEYPPIILLKEMMGMAASPLPSQLKKIIVTCGFDSSAEAKVGRIPNYRIMWNTLQILVIFMSE